MPVLGSKLGFALDGGAEMAQIKTVAITNSAWTRIDSLSLHTYIEVASRDDQQMVGLKISDTDPGATAWDSGDVRILQRAGEWPMRLGTTDKIWAKSETGSMSLSVAEAT